MSAPALTCLKTHWTKENVSYYIKYQSFISLPYNLVYNNKYKTTIYNAATEMAQYYICFNKL